MLLLSFERGSSAIGQYTRFRARAGSRRSPTHRARDRRGSKDPAIRQRIARRPRRTSSRCSCTRWHILTKVEQGEQLGFESSMTKLQWSRDPSGPRRDLPWTSWATRASRCPGCATSGARPAAGAVPVVAVGDHLGRLVAGAAQHRRRARARPAPLASAERRRGVLRSHRRAARAAGRRYASTSPTASPRPRCARSTTTRPATGFPDALWQAFGEQGWLAVHGARGARRARARRARRGRAQPLPGRGRGARARGCRRSSPARRCGSAAAGRPKRPSGCERIAAGEVKLAFAPDLSLPVEYAAVADALVAVQRRRG